jgi:hypothetical protein
MAYQRHQHYPIPRFPNNLNNAYHLDVTRFYLKPSYILKYDSNGQIILEFDKMQQINEFVSPIVFVINVNGRLKCIRWITVNGKITIDETNII